MRVIRFDKAECDRVARIVGAALAETASELGLELTCVGGTYDSVDGMFRPRLELRLPELDGVPRERALFERHASAYGFAPSDYGRDVVLSGTRYRLVGFKPGSRYGVEVVSHADGRRLGYRPDVIRGALR